MALLDKIPYQIASPQAYMWATAVVWNRNRTTGFLYYRAMHFTLVAGPAHYTNGAFCADRPPAHVVTCVNCIGLLYYFH